MDDAVFVHVFQSFAHLSQVVYHLSLGHLVILSSYPIKQLSSGQTEIKHIKSEELSHN